jgi:hypothetical protein
MTNMLNSSGLSTENYSRTLIGWANSVDANSDLPAAVTLGATGRTYNNTAYVSGADLQRRSSRTGVSDRSGT